MRSFDEYLEESLVDVAREPKTKTAKQAKQLGLRYVGFGRYVDNSGKKTYYVDGDKLVPYRKTEEIHKMMDKVQDLEWLSLDKPRPAKGKPDKDAEKLKAFRTEFKTSQQTKRKADTHASKILREKMKEAQKINKELMKFYNPGMFSDEEREAIDYYTAEGYEYINKYLYKGHDEGADYRKDQEIAQLIHDLDSAFDGAETPFPYTVYTGLSARYSASKLMPGEEYIFRGYVSSSLDFDVSIGSFTPESESKQNERVVLQIDLDKGQKAIHVDAISSNNGESETILPRGSKIKIVSGPHPMPTHLFTGGNSDYTDAWGDPVDKSTVMLFHCKVIEDKD